MQPSSTAAAAIPITHIHQLPIHPHTPSKKAPQLHQPAQPSSSCAPNHSHHAQQHHHSSALLSDDDSYAGSRRNSSNSDATHFTHELEYSTESGTCYGLTRSRRSSTQQAGEGLSSSITMHFQSGGNASNMSASDAPLHHHDLDDASLPIILISDIDDEFESGPLYEYVPSEVEQQLAARFSSSLINNMMHGMTPYPMIGGRALPLPTIIEEEHILSTCGDLSPRASASSTATGNHHGSQEIPRDRLMLSMHSVHRAAHHHSGHSAISGSSHSNSARDGSMGTSLSFETTSNPDFLTSFNRQPRTSPPSLTSSGPLHSGCVTPLDTHQSPASSAHRLRHSIASSHPPPSHAMDSIPHSMHPRYCLSPQSPNITITMDPAHANSTHADTYIPPFYPQYYERFSRRSTTLTPMQAYRDFLSAPLMDHVPALPSQSKLQSNRARGHVMRTLTPVPHDMHSRFTSPTPPDSEPTTPPTLGKGFLGTSFGSTASRLGLGLSTFSSFSSRKNVMHSMLSSTPSSPPPCVPLPVAALAPEPSGCFLWKLRSSCFRRKKSTNMP